MQFVDVTNDIAFRKIFGNENRKEVLISFLNAVIDFPQGRQVQDVEITNPYQLPKLSNGKTTIVDVKARDEKGNVFIVEMQVANFEFFDKRVLYYSSQSYAGQIDKGEDYGRLRPVYFIGILEFEIGKNPCYFSRHKVLDVETAEQVIQDVEFNFIELPKFTKTIDQLKTPVDQWTYFIKNAEKLTAIPDNITDSSLRIAYVEADRQSWTRPELEDYERASMWIQDERGRIAFATRKAEAVGKAEGRAEGKAEGRAEAKAEEKAAVIKQGKLMGLSTAALSQLTGLSEAEIEKM